MKLPRVLAFCALFGLGWAVPAQAADDRRGSASAQTAKNRPGQPAQSARREGRPASAAATAHRRHRDSKGRLAPGREVIDRSGRPQRGRASYYGREFNGRKMANGRPFNPDSNVAASRSLPLGTVARVKNRQSGRETTVKVEDRSPYVPGRILDVAPRAADDLDMRRQGGAALAASPWLFGFADRVRRPHLAFGLFAVAASLVTRTRPEEGASYPAPAPGRRALARPKRELALPPPARRS